MFLPAAISAAWALVIMATKRRPTRAQLVLSMTMLVIAFSSVVLGIFFRGRAGSLFIYDFVFECFSMICAPMYYVGICSLTEARGASLRQRRVFFIPLFFIVGLTVGAFWLGPRRYEEMCHLLRDETVGWIAGDTAWNFMLYWDHYFFPVLMLLMSTILIFISSRKVHLYQRRFNSYYAKDMHIPFIDSREISIFTWIFLPLGVLVVLLIDLRPFYYKYWLIGCMVILSVLQFFMGRFVYRLNYDARFLADYIRSAGWDTKIEGEEGKQVILTETPETL